MKNGVERLSLRHLRLIVAVLNYGNLVGAARQLNLTQPAVTKALQEAEALVGEHIFRRTNRGVFPTIYGEALSAHAQLILAQLAHASEEVADLRDGRGGRVAIGTLLSASAELLPKAIATLREERPRLAISVTEGANDRLLPLLRTGELDFVVGRFGERENLAGLSQEKLFSDVAYVVARPDHPLRSKRHLSIAALREARWILPTGGTSLRHQIELAFHEEGIELPAFAVESVSLVTNQALITDADHVAVWPWPLARREEALGRIAILPIALKATVTPLGITTRKDARLSPAVRDAIITIREISKTIEPSPLVRRGI